MAQTDTSFAQQFNAAVAWWKDAGVDYDFADDATEWLAEPEAEEPAKPAKTGPAKKAEAPQEPAPQKVDLLGENPPQNLESWREFWLSEPGLDTIGPRGRIAATGKAEAEMMVLVVDPEQGDRDQILSQAQGHLLDRILTAMGTSRDAVYIASALPRHTPMADCHALAAGGFEGLVKHHIALARPKTILALGRNILPFLGHEAAQDDAALSEYCHDNSRIPMMVAESLESMMGSPRLKARFWRRWLAWTQQPE
ncbi:MAG: uracil-DNA glycosylase family protein [Erythrobacter sp.]